MATTAQRFVALMEKLYNENDNDDSDDDAEAKKKPKTPPTITTTTLTADESVAIVLSAHNYYAMQGLCDDSPACDVLEGARAFARQVYAEASKYKYEHPDTFDANAIALAVDEAAMAAMEY